MKPPAQGVNPAIQFDVKHRSIQEQEGAERLILCVGSDVFLDGEVGEKPLDIGGAQLFRMPFTVKVIFP